LTADEKRDRTATGTTSSNICEHANTEYAGGITEWLRVAAVAAAHHLQISGHCAPTCTSTPRPRSPTNLRHLEWFHDHVRIEEMFFDGTLDPTGGAVVPDPDLPGNGLTLRDDVVRRYQVGDTIRREAAVAGVSR
jgi:L-alanine-DL-glutamate epimerase-like enolase superfamily enzyme